MLTAVVFAPLAVLLGQVLARDGLAVVPVDDHVGVLAAVVQFLGLARWPFLVRHSREPSTSRLQPGDTRCDRGRVRLVQPLPRSRGRRVPRLPLHRSVDGARRHRDAPVVHVRRRGSPGPASSSARFLVVGSLEFVGRFEENGWKLAGTIVPIAYTVWSLWLVATGIVLLT